MLGQVGWCQLPWLSSGCTNKIPKTGGLKWQNVTYPSSGCWEKHDEVLNNLVSDEDFLPGVQMSVFLYPCVSWCGGERDRAWVYSFLSFLPKATNSIRGLYPHYLISPRGPVSKYHHTGEQGFNIWILGEHKYSVHSIPYCISLENYSFWKRDLGPE